jgi:adenylate kinase
MVRVFINQVDSYTGGCLSKYLSKAVVGGSLGEGNDEDAETQGEQEGGKEGGANTYEIIGTMKDSAAAKPEWVQSIVTKKEDLLQTLLTCDVIIYNTIDDPTQVEEATEVVNALHQSLPSFENLKTFICISTVLTWARSKPVDPEEPDIPFTEEDYRRRRCHPNFKEHIALEKLVIKLGKTDKLKFMTYVVAAGVLYGEEESMFHSLFKAAWHGDPAALKVYGEGENIVPTIHVKDLGGVIVNIADSRPKVRYLLAVDAAQNTLREIVKAVSVALGTGRIDVVPKEDAFLDKDITQNIYDHLLVNLTMEATYVKDSMHVDWVAEEGFVENIRSIVREYKQARGLIPIKVCVLGPPAVGKTTTVTQLCKHYKLHHLKMADIIRETLERYERLAARVEIQDEDEESDERAQQAQEYLDLLKEDKENEEHVGRYSDEHIIQFFKEKLKSMPCQNQGYILDGYPKTYEQAKELFAPDEEDEEDGNDDVSSQYNSSIMPDVVISLDASDEFLKDRVMNLPESVVTGTHFTQHEFLSKLSKFRVINEEDSTVLNYFDELEVHPVHIDVMKDNSSSMEATVESMKEHVGQPRNYGWC